MMLRSLAAVRKSSIFGKKHVSRNLSSTTDFLTTRVHKIRNKDDFAKEFSVSPIPIIQNKFNEHTLLPTVHVERAGVDAFVSDFAPNLMHSDILLSDMDEYSRYFFVYDFIREAVALSPNHVSILATPNALTKYKMLNSCHTFPTHRQHFANKSQFYDEMSALDHALKVSENETTSTGPIMQFSEADMANVQGQSMFGSNSQPSGDGNKEVTCVDVIDSDPQSNANRANHKNMRNTGSSMKEEGKTQAVPLTEPDTATNDIATATTDMSHKMNIVAYDKAQCGRILNLTEVRKHISGHADSEAIHYQFIAQLLLVLMRNDADVPATSPRLARADSVYGCLSDGDEYRMYRVSTQHHHENSTTNKPCTAVHVVETAPPIILLDRHLLPNRDSLQQLLAHLCSSFDIPPATAITADYVRHAFNNPSYLRKIVPPASVAVPIVDSVVLNNPHHISGFQTRPACNEAAANSEQLIKPIAPTASPPNSAADEDVAAVYEEPASVEHVDPQLAEMQPRNGMEESVVLPVETHDIPRGSAADDKTTVTDGNSQPDTSPATSSHTVSKTDLHEAIKGFQGEVDVFLRTSAHNLKLRGFSDSETAAILHVTEQELTRIKDDTCGRQVGAVNMWRGDGREWDEEQDEMDSAEEGGWGSGGEDGDSDAEFKYEWEGKGKKDCFKGEVSGRTGDYDDDDDEDDLVGADDLLDEEQSVHSGERRVAGGRASYRSSGGDVSGGGAGLLDDRAMSDTCGPVVVYDRYDTLGHCTRSQDNVLIDPIDGHSNAIPRSNATAAAELAPFKSPEQHKYYTFMVDAVKTTETNIGTVESGVRASRSDLTRLKYRVYKQLSQDGYNESEIMAIMQVGPAELHVMEKRDPTSDTNWGT